MAFDGSGVFLRVRNWMADAAAGIKIKADYHDSEDDNLAAGLTNCITKDGQTIITQNIPFNAKRITSLADPVNPQDAVTKTYADTKVPIAGGVMTGTVIIRSADPELILDDVGGTTGGAWVEGSKNGESRWLMRLGDGTAESGGNVGTDFDLVGYGDDEAFIGRALAFTRKTLLGTVFGDPQVPLGIATKQYADTKLSSAGGVITGPISASPSFPIGTVGSVQSIQITAGGSEAAMTFLVPGLWGANFGLNPDGNFYMGGYSYGNGVKYKFWTTREIPNPPVSNVRLALAGDFSLTTPGQGPPPSEPFPGAVMTGFSWIINSGIPTPQQFRFRYMQFYTTSWYTVGYA